jgi:hypothetical protein
MGDDAELVAAAIADFALRAPAPAAASTPQQVA